MSSWRCCATVARPERGLGCTDWGWTVGSLALHYSPLANDAACLCMLITETVGWETRSSAVVQADGSSRVGASVLTSGGLVVLPTAPNRPSHSSF